MTNHSSCKQPKKTIRIHLEANLCNWHQAWQALFCLITQSLLWAKRMSAKEASVIASHWLREWHKFYPPPLPSMTDCYNAKQTTQIAIIISLHSQLKPLYITTAMDMTHDFLLEAEALYLLHHLVLNFFLFHFTEPQIHWLVLKTNCLLLPRPPQWIMWRLRCKLWVRNKKIQSSILLCHNAEWGAVFILYVV